MKIIKELDTFEGIPVVALTKQGVFVGEYPNFTDCAYKLSIHSQNISYFFKGKTNHVKEYIFVKKENYTEGMKITYNSIVRKRKFLKSKI